MAPREQAVYPLSADPIQYGHINVIERALKVFGRIIVTIGNNAKKKYTFSIEERTDMASRALAHLGDRVLVLPFYGLLVDFVRSQDIKIILRGVRNSVIDFDFESIINQVNYNLDKEIESYILFSDPKYSHISSSTVKELTQAYSLEIHKYVPFPVKKKLERKLLNQMRIGITGEIGAGKSYVDKIFVECIRANDIPCYSIDLDSIGKRILTELDTPLAVRTRAEVRALLWGDLYPKDHPVSIGRDSVLWSQPSYLQRFNEIMTQPFLIEIASALRGLEGIIFINSAVFAEQGISYLCNNEVVLISADLEVRRTRLKERGYSSEEILKRIDSQYSSERKKAIIEGEISKARHGWLVELDNSEATRSGIQNFCLQEILAKW